MNYFLTAALLLNLATLTFLVLLSVEIWRKLRDFRGFIESPDGNSPSALSQVYDAATARMARAVVDQAKVTLMGIKSGEVRAEQAVMTGLGEAALGESPIGAALTSVPGIRKFLRKNPGLLNVVLSKLSNPPASVEAAPLNTRVDLNRYGG